MIRADAVSDYVFSWKRGTAATDLGDLAFPRAPTLIAPNDLATGVRLDTRFRVTDGAGARTFGWLPTSGGPAIWLTTERTEVTMPDPDQGGFFFPSRADAEWTVIGHGGADTETAAAAGYVALYEFFGTFGSGCPGARSEAGSLSFGEQRSFTFGVATVIVACEALSDAVPPSDGCGPAQP